MTHTLVEIERAFRSSWGADTTCLAPGSLPGWRPENPAHGQCGPTALVVQDLLGGDLLIADVSEADGPSAVHYWNRLQGGLEIDLTRDQFANDHVVGEPRVVVRPPEGPRAHVEEYRLLHRRVSAALGLVRHVERADSSSAETGKRPPW